MTVVTARRLPLPVRGLGAFALVGSGVLWGAQPVPSWIWFFAKTYALIFVLVWLRGTFPRLRIDQLMGLAWKFLLPLGLVNILAAGLWAWYPFPVGTIAATLLLVVSSWLLVRANAPETARPLRHYVFAE